MLHHATREIPPPLIDRTVSFYGLLGFVEVPTPPGIGARARWVEQDATQIHLMPVEGAAPQSGHLAVTLPDWEAGVSRLQRAGHAVEPRRAHWNSPRAYVRDPAGNLVEIMQSPPARRT